MLSTGDMGNAVVAFKPDSREETNMRTHNGKAINFTANGMKVEDTTAPTTHLDNLATVLTEKEIRTQIKLSVAANRSIIADAADKAVRAALQSFGIVS